MSTKKQNERGEDNSFPLGTHATEFQAQIFAILKRTSQNLRLMCKWKRTSFLSGSQAAQKVINNPKKNIVVSDRMLRKT